MGLFYLDEDIPPEVGKILAQRSHDVVHVFDLGVQSTKDPEHIRVAAREERILLRELPPAQPLPALLTQGDRWCSHC